MTETEQQSLAYRLRSRRQRLMLSQEEAAAQLLVSRRVYQLWESGEVLEPHPSRLRRIEAWLQDGAN